MALVEWVTRMYVTLTESTWNSGDSYSDVSNIVWSLPTAFWFWHKKKEFGSGFFLAALRGNSTVWIRRYLYLFFLNRLRLMSNKVLMHNAQGWLKNNLYWLETASEPEKISLTVCVLVLKGNYLLIDTGLRERDRVFVSTADNWDYEWLCNPDWQK